LLFLFITAISSSQNVDRPNIVFVLADDATNWDFGCYGSKDSKTPNIDKLAEEGLKI